MSFDSRGNLDDLLATQVHLEHGIGQQYAGDDGGGRGAESATDRDVRRRIDCRSSRRRTGDSTRCTEPASEQVLGECHRNGGQPSTAADRDARSCCRRDGRDEPPVHRDADAVEAGTQVARARRHANVRCHDLSPFTKARTSATRGAMRGA